MFLCSVYAFDCTAGNPRSYMACIAVRGQMPEAKTDDPKFYNLEEVEDLARNVLPKAVSTRIFLCLFQGAG